MLRFALVFLVIAVIAGVYAIAAPGVFANVLAFCSIVVLYLSLLGNRKAA